MEMLREEGGYNHNGGRHDFSWWPKTGFRLSRDSAGNKLWIADNAIIEEGAHLIGPLMLGPGTIIKRGSIIQRSVIGAGWEIGGGAITDSVLWPDRLAIGLPPGPIPLLYKLSGTVLEHTLIGSGFHPDKDSFFVDDGGNYGLAFTNATYKNQPSAGESGSSPWGSPSGRATGINFAVTLQPHNIRTDRQL